MIEHNLLSAIPALLILAASCLPARGSMLINAAGSTFGYPIYSKWFNVYAKENPNPRFNYQSIGSGGGIKLLTDKTVEVGGSDAPLNDRQMKAAPGPVLHFPTMLDVVSITDAPGQEAYPISSFTWMIIYTRQSNHAIGEATVNFLRWAITKGQKYAPPMNYATLPKNVRKTELAQLKEVKLPKK